jgi:molybdate transport system ATP-binding protein
LSNQPKPHRARLSAQIRHRIGTLDIDVDFQLTQPWIILFGPSGSGKSTILRAIAGLVRPASARIVSSSTLVDTEDRLFLPPYQRVVPLAPQQPSLFPHLTVSANICYALSFRKPSRYWLQNLELVLSLFQVSHLSGKLPAALSGGEAQRVNLARAAVATTVGGILLLDEPFTGLDPTLRSELMTDLQAWAAKRDLCVLSVTHDIAEAFQLNAEVIKLSNGRITHQGPAAAVLAEERTRLLAQLNGPAKAGGPSPGSQ